MKSIFEEEKSLIVEHNFFWKTVPYWAYFGQGDDFKLTTELSKKSATFPQPSTQKRLKWSYTAYVNKWSFTFKKLCAFQATMTYFCIKVIRTFNVQPVKIPHFKSPLTCKQAQWPHFFNCIFIMFISWMLITPSFKKSLTVEQFQGNYLNWQNYEQQTLN